PREENIRHSPATEIGWPGVMRVLEPALELDREALDEPGVRRAERTRKPPRDRVHHHHCRQLAPGKNVRPDRDRVAGEMCEHTLVEALEARREQGEPLLACELLDHLLRQLPALRRQRNDSMRRRAVGGLE